MTDKDKADCLIELHKEQMGKFKQTRDIEFKVNLALWSFIILAGYYLSKEIELKEYINYLIYTVIYLTVSFFIVFAHYKLWMKPIHASEDTDDYYINQYREQVERLAEITIMKNKDFKKESQNWTIFEVGITAFLLIVAGIYIAI